MSVNSTKLSLRLSSFSGRKSLLSESGFTLIEVLIAALILGIGFTGNRRTSN